MPEKKPLYLHLLIFICRSVSYGCTALHFVLIKAGLLKSPEYLVKFPGKKFKTLHSIWHARLARRCISFLLRTPLRKNILKMINFNIPLPADRGCIIVTCHTPWKRLLANWCLEKKFALLIGGGKWKDRRHTIQRKGAGITELRNLVNHLQNRGCVITNADFFNTASDCPVKFLGKELNASLFTERLASLAKVPVLTTIPELSGTRIEFRTGPQFLADDPAFKPAFITTQIISFFEKEIENNPASWSFYVK